MTKKIKYSDEPMGRTRVVNDFLPSPAELTIHEEAVKITLQLSRASVEYFKKEA